MYIIGIIFARKGLTSANMNQTKVLLKKNKVMDLIASYF